MGIIRSIFLLVRHPRSGAPDLGGIRILCKHSLDFSFRDGE